MVCAALLVKGSSRVGVRRGVPAAPQAKRAHPKRGSADRRIRPARRRAPGMVAAAACTDVEWAMRRFTLLLLAAALAAVLAQSALAAGGSYTFAGGTAKQQAMVRSALAASSFDWNVLPRPVVVHIAPVGGSYSEAGHVHLDSTLLDSGRFSWGVVQHEFAHQVDFLLFDEATRAMLNRALGGSDWCYGVAGVAHSAYGCE